MSAENCFPSVAEWCVSVVLGNDREGDTSEFHEYFRGEQPKRSDVWTAQDRADMRRMGWKVLEFKVQKIER